MRRSFSISRSMGSVMMVRLLKNTTRPGLPCLCANSSIGGIHAAIMAPAVARMSPWRSRISASSVAAPSSSLASVPSNAFAN